MRNSASVTTLLVLSFIYAPFLVHSQSSLSSDFYDNTCPRVFGNVRQVVENAVRTEPRMGASLLRLHFHDCFVQGCDASILLDDTATVTGEKTAPPNNGSVRGYEVIDMIKTLVEADCPGVVSCADIVALAARDSVEILSGKGRNGLSWDVELGRRDSLSPASRNDVLANLPPAIFNLSQLITNFANKNLSITDLVALSGGHTIGMARCRNFRNHIYNESNIDGSFAKQMQRDCPASGGDDELGEMDNSPNRFNNEYFKQLLKFRGLLHSDQELFGDNGGATDSIVVSYARSEKTFFRDFASAMIKMGRLDVLTGDRGEIRANCRRLN